MDKIRHISFMVNKETVSAQVNVRQNLVDFLREKIGLTGTHVGCEHGVCGACTVKLDGQIVRGCLMLAVQADGAHIETIEGASDSGDLLELQEAFLRRNALQCGFCTPAMLLTAQQLIEAGGATSRDAVRDYISGNYCRCTGYQSIVDAILDVAKSKDEGKQT